MCCIWRKLRTFMVDLFIYFWNGNFIKTAKAVQERYTANKNTGQQAKKHRKRKKKKHLDKKIYRKCIASPLTPSLAKESAMELASLLTCKKEAWRDVERSKTSSITWACLQGEEHFPEGWSPLTNAKGISFHY